MVHDSECQAHGLPQSVEEKERVLKKSTMHLFLPDLPKQTLSVAAGWTSKQPSDATYVFKGKSKYDCSTLYGEEETTPLVHTHNTGMWHSQVVCMINE